MSKRDIKAKRWARREFKRVHASFCHDYEQYQALRKRKSDANGDTGDVVVLSGNM